MVTLKFDHYYKYDELSEALKKLELKFNSICNLNSVGKSVQGRELWIMEITDKKTGEPEDKPAVWIDGNTHAGEVMGSMVCLKIIHYLLSRYNQDPIIKNLLSKTTFYILPRVDPDGAEFVLTTPYYVLSADIETGGGRWYPLSEKEWKASQKGLFLEDIDGDGVIVKMRIPDPSGEWKLSEHDNRIMILRSPEDKEGEFYRLYPEGMILNYQDETEIKMAPARWGLNLGGNWPGNWGTEDYSRGSGPYPLSEPETRSIADFILSHSNICIGITYHTHGGVLFGYSEYEELPLQDRKLFKIIESIFEEKTSYPSHSIQRRRGVGGSFSSFMTLHRGIPCTTVEVWDLISRLDMGNFVQRGGFYNSPEKAEEQELKLMTWNQKELDGDAFVEWHEFNHPQLGKVEIGGWTKKFLWRNPPNKFIENEINRNMYFPIDLAHLLPKIVVKESKVIMLSNNIYEISVTLENVGVLPTYIMQQALDINILKPSKIFIETGKNIKLIEGKKQMSFHLEGFLNKILTGSRYERENIKDKNKATFHWIIETENTSNLSIHYYSPKVGKGMLDLKLCKE